MVDKNLVTYWKKIIRFRQWNRKLSNQKIFVTFALSDRQIDGYNDQPI